MRYDAKMTFARMLSDSAGINLIETQDQQASLKYNGYKYEIHMPILPANLEDDDPRSVWWWGTLCDLIDRLHPEVRAMERLAASMYSPNSMFGQVLTRVLATNATHVGFKEYAGKDTWVLDAFDQDAIAYEQVLANQPPTERNDIALTNVVLLDQVFKSIKYATGVAEYAPAVPVLQKITEDEELCHLYNEKKTSLQPIIKITKSILRHLEYDPEEEEEKSKEQAKQEQEGQAGGEAESGDEDTYGGGTVNFKDIGDDSGEGMPNGGLTIKYDKKDLYDDETYVPEDMKIHGQLGRSQPCPYLSNKLTKHVANLLKVRSQVRWQGARRSGKLRRKSLARLVSDPSYDRPFRQKEDNEVLDTCVILLVDTSGSMSGHRYEMATESAIKLCDVLSSVHIPVEVLGFTQRYRENDIYVHKSFHDKADMDRIYGSLQHGHGHGRMGSNDDGASLDYAYQSIMKQKQKRKIIIVLSDGQPACGSKLGYNEAAYLKRIVKQVEKDVEVFAIGIQTHSVEHFYTNSKVLQDVRQLEPTVIGIIKEKVI